MNPNKSRQTVYDRATPERRATLRRRALAVPCPYCQAPADVPCKGLAGKPAKPHSARQASCPR